MSQFSWVMVLVAFLIGDLPDGGAGWAALKLAFALGITVAAFRIARKAG